MARIWNVNNKIQLDSYLSKVRAKRWMWLQACVFVQKIFVSPARSFVVTKHHHHRRLSIECAMNERFVLRVYLKTTKRESKLKHTLKVHMKPHAIRISHSSSFYSHISIGGIVNSPKRELFS